MVINTTDPDRLVGFWSKVLGVEEQLRIPGFVWLKPQTPDGVKLAFQLVDAPTEGRRRLHLDFGVKDLEAATASIIEAGGSHLEDHNWGDFHWRVMADPDGNEFCIGDVA